MNKKTKLANENQAYKKANRHKVIIIVTICVSILVLVVAGYFINNLIAQRKNEAEFNKLASQSQQLINDEKYSEAVDLWQSYLKKPLSQNIKCQAKAKHANALLLSGNYSISKNVYEDVLNNCKNISQPEIVLGIAKSYDGQGNSKKAIEYYQKYIDMLKSQLQSNSQNIDKSKIEYEINYYTQVINDINPRN